MRATPSPKSFEDLFNPYIVHTNFRSRSIFFLVQSKGPYVEMFYQVVYRDLIKLCRCNLTVKWLKANLYDITVGCVESPTTDPILHEDYAYSTSTFKILPG